MAESYNIAAAINEMARLYPDTLAIAIPEKNSLDKNGITRYKKVTFKELAFEIKLLSNGLHAYGFNAGDRVVMMVPPGLDFFVVSFSMLYTGVVPIFIDPGIGIKNLSTCINETEPAGFIGISRAHIARLLLGWGKKTIHKTITIGPRLFWGGKTIQGIRNNGKTSKQVSLFEAKPEDIAAIIFTSGSTGLAKGVVYSHGNFHEQLNMIGDTFQFSPGEIDMPTFAPYALFNAALGITSIIPDMNPTKPARVNPLNIIYPVKQFGITNMFASPAIIEAVGRYGEENNTGLPSLRRVISSGAPASTKAIKRFSSMLNPDAQIFTPYGSTEAMPVSLIGSHQILMETCKKTENGNGVCIGKPVQNVEVAIIGITDDEIPNWRDDLKLATGKVGEIVIKGKNVTKSYFNRYPATKLAKINDGNEVRHRMGDLGYFDAEGNIWFCGRKSDRVIINDRELYSIQCEYIFNSHQDVFRTALVCVNNAAILCVETEKNGKPVDKSNLKLQLLEIACSHEITRDIRTILFHPRFPVDIRHNAKILREKLAVWAKNKLS